jgi:predicted O-methyltransferase YrrM
LASALNVIRNAFRPGYGTVMTGKVLRRLEPDTHAEATRWSMEHARSTEDVCRAIDEELWDEAAAWSETFRPQAEARLALIGVDLGGGGDARLLYFLTRLGRPEHVVETGVAAGWSSAAILAAMERNGKGTLHSSDFPYFRLASPENYVGVLVPERHRAQWRLHLRGDRRNLPRIFSEAGPVELFHFDSDKSVRGRRLAMSLAAPHLAPDAIIVMDDIHNNTYFYDHVAALGRPWLVLEHHVGVIGLAPRS